MVGLRHALVAALVGGALLPPVAAEAQLGRTGRTQESRQDCSLAERTRRAGEIILGRDGRRTTRDDDCRDVDSRRDDRVDRDCGIIIIGDRSDCRVRDDRRDGRVDTRNRGRRVQRGPAFCRSGAGHPVHGRRWCRDKGFPLGSDRLDRRDRDDRYDRRDRDGGGIFRLPDSRRRGVLDRGDLIDILGSRTYSQLDQLRRRHGLRQSLQGRWYRDRLGRDAILISAGTVPVADLVSRGRGYELVFRLR
jgi:hypothetical protein